jgi:hypothetical protein
MLSAIIASREQHARARADATSRAARARAQAARWRPLERFNIFSAPRAEPPREALDKRDDNARVTISTLLREKFRAKAKKLLHRLLNALMSRPPNFARACGRVPVGGHPDKRPDSRPE